MRPNLLGGAIVALGEGSAANAKVAGTRGAPVPHDLHKTVKSTGRLEISWRFQGHSAWHAFCSSPFHSKGGSKPVRNRFIQRKEVRIS